LLAAALLWTVSISGPPAPAAAGPTDLPLVYVTPESTVVAEGTDFQLHIAISEEATHLMGYNIKVTFDSTVIHLRDVVEGSLPATSGHNTFFHWFDSGMPQDTVHVNGAVLGATVPGPGELFTLVFKAATGLPTDRETDVVITYTDIRNGVNEQIDHTIRNGWVKVLRPVDVESRTWGAVKGLYQ
jgi:hypothetical protein